MSPINFHYLSYNQCFTFQLQLFQSWEIEHGGGGVGEVM
jgi:hypothetical protein